MNLNYDIWLLVISTVASSASLLIAFDFVRRLYLYTISTKRIMLPVYSFVVATAIWGNHYLVSLSFHADAKLSSPVLAIAGWLFSAMIAFGLLFVSSQSNSKIWHFLLYGFIASFCDLALFYCSSTSLHESSIIKFDYALTFIATTISGTLTALISLKFYWVRNYEGKHPNMIKVLVAIAIALGILAIHLAFESAVSHKAEFVSSSISQTNQQLTGISIGLGMLCLFMMLFIFTLFFEKHGTLLLNFGFLSLFKKIDIQIDNILDPLTNLPNRIGFQHNLDNAISRSQRSGKTIALAFIDLDHFKPINDNYGHQVGDVVLASSANRLNAAVRGCDSLARIGGDEFIAIIEGIKSNEDIFPIVERIVHSINQPFLIDNQKIEISCSVGVAIYPGDGDTDKLMACADAAMYKAKENGKNQFKFYDAEIELAADKMLELQRDLMLALENEEFSLVFQPKVDCKTMSPIGAEAFIRWNHPTKGLLHPKHFIHAAERFGLINQINNWVIEEACVAIYRAKESDIDLNLSINLSRIQFRNSSLVDETIKCLDKYGVPAQNLTLEIKETTAVRNEAQFKLLIAKFKTANIKIALDDFGLNPFTLEYLQELHVDELKLDNVFVAKVNENPDSHALVDAVIRLAHAFNLNVVAEGVETETQRKALAELGCDHMQGYLYSKPIPEAELLHLLKSPALNFELSSPILMDNNLSKVI